MNLKEGVQIQGATTELLFGLIVANQVYSDFGYELTVTSLLDGKHSLSSLHYSGNAGDLRTRNVAPEDRPPIRDKIKENLGIDYDVVLESTHIHLEYQPRRRG